MPTKILIGSVLKPVDDIRHYHKIAKSLLQKDVEIHIFGFYSEAKSEDQRVIFHPSKSFKRISLNRVLTPIRFFLLGLKLKPRTIICGTHELLKVSVYLRLFTKAKIVYDIRENYYHNIIYTKTFPSLIKYPIAWIVRINEWIGSLAIDHYLLAEKCYENELSFIEKRPYTVIENKYKPVQQLEIKTHKVENLDFIITGTITELYGINEAIAFFKKVSDIDPKAKLSIIGIYRGNTIPAKHKYANIQWEIDSKPIPYSKIQSVLKKGGIALLPYQPNKSTKEKIPTKFYEYLYYHIPMIIQKNSIWEDFLEPYKAAIFIDFKNFNPEKVIRQINEFAFYSGKKVGEEVIWNGEDKKFLNIDLIRKIPQYSS